MLLGIPFTEQDSQALNNFKLDGIMQKIKLLSIEL